MSWLQFKHTVTKCESGHQKHLLKVFYLALLQLFCLLLQCRLHIIHLLLQGRLTHSKQTNNFYAAQCVVAYIYKEVTVKNVPRNCAGPLFLSVEM